MIRTNNSKRGFLFELIKNKPLFAMLIPGCLLLLVFNYIPLIGLIIAFKDSRTATNVLKSKWVGWKNFEFFFTSQDAFRVTFNTIFMNLLFISSVLVIALTFALLLNELRHRLLSRLYQSIMFLPYFLSYVIVGFVAYAFLNVDAGVMNNIVEFFGHEPINWYSEPKYWPYILVIVNLWKSVGFSALMYLAAITSINEEYYEAAKIDGASKFQMALKITVPLITPLITILTLLAIGRIFYADFGLFYYLPRETGVLFSKTDVIDTYVYRALKTMGDIGMSSAVGFYQSVVGFVMIMASNLIVRKINSDNALF